MVCPTKHFTTAFTPLGHGHLVVNRTGDAAILAVQTHVEEVHRSVGNLREVAGNGLLGLAKYDDRALGGVQVQNFGRFTSGTVHSGFDASAARGDAEHAGVLRNTRPNPCCGESSGNQSGSSRKVHDAGEVHGCGGLGHAINSDGHGGRSFSLHSCQNCRHSPGQRTASRRREGVCGDGTNQESLGSWLLAVPSGGSGIDFASREICGDFLQAVVGADRILLTNGGDKLFAHEEQRAKPIGGNSIRGHRNADVNQVGNWNRHLLSFDLDDLVAINKYATHNSARHDTNWGQLLSENVELHLNSLPKLPVGFEHKRSKVERLLVHGCKLLLLEYSLNIWAVERVVKLDELTTLPREQNLECQYPNATAAVHFNTANVHNFGLIESWVGTAHTLHSGILANWPWRTLLLHLVGEAGDSNANIYDSFNRLDFAIVNVHHFSSCLAAMTT